MRLTVRGWLKAPEVPVMVTVADAGTARLLAVRVSTLVVVVAGALNEAVTPAGRPVTDKPTVPLKLASGTTEISVVAVLPGVRSMPTWEAYSVKSFVPVPAR